MISKKTWYTFFFLSLQYHYPLAILDDRRILFTRVGGHDVRAYDPETCMDGFGHADMTRGCVVIGRYVLKSWGGLAFSLFV
jgi:hypothetical protein